MLCFSSFFFYCTHKSKSPFSNPIFSINPRFTEPTDQARTARRQENTFFPLRGCRVGAWPCCSLEDIDDFSEHWVSFRLWGHREGGKVTSFGAESWWVCWVCIDLELRWRGTCSSSALLCVDWARSWSCWFLALLVPLTMLLFWPIMALLCMLEDLILLLPWQCWSCFIAW